MTNIFGGYEMFTKREKKLQQTVAPTKNLPRLLIACGFFCILEDSEDYDIELKLPCRHAGQSNVNIYICPAP